MGTRRDVGARAAGHRPCQDALNALHAANGFKPDDPVSKARREGILHSRILVELGQIQHAVESLPDLDVVGEHPRDWVEWAQVVFKLSEQDAIQNSWQLGRIVRQWMSYFETMGSPRARLELAFTGARLALRRQGVWQARLLADLAEVASRELKSADDVAERIAALRAECDAAVETPAPGPEGELVAYFDAADGRTADPERWVGWLWPLSGKDLEATRRHTTTLGFLGYAPTGADIYWQMTAVDGDPAQADTEDVAYLTGLLIEAEQDERVHDLAGRLKAPASHLALARLHRARERWERRPTRPRRPPRAARASSRCACGQARSSTSATTSGRPRSCARSSTATCRARKRTSGA